MDLSPFGYAVYKLIKYLVYPFTWLALLLGLLVIVLWRPRAGQRLIVPRLIAILLLLLIGLLGNPIVAGLLLGPLEAQYPPFDLSRHDRIHAIVVLGGGINEKGSLRPADTPSPVTMERALCGFDLFAHHISDRLIFSAGDAKVIGQGPKEALEMKRLAVKLGVPADAIATETQSRTTYESAVEMKQLVGTQPIVLVTSASHMPRAMALFRKQGMAVTAAPCGYSVRNWPDQSWELPFHLIPNVEAFERSTIAINEHMGLWVYGFLGKL